MVESNPQPQQMLQEAHPDPAHCSPNRAWQGDVRNLQTQRAAVQPQGRIRRFAPKQVIYRKNDRAERTYRIRSGLVKLISYLPSGQVRIVRLHTAGQWIGYEGLLEAHYWHTAVVVDSSEADCYYTSQLQGLMPDGPLHEGLGQDRSRQNDAFIQSWRDDLMRADRWIADFSTGEIRPRVARLLQYLAELEYGLPLHRVKLLTVQEMAEILGVTQESVSRVLACFKRSAILQRQSQKSGPCGRELYQLDAERLSLEACR